MKAFIPDDLKQYAIESDWHYRLLSESQFGLAVSTDPGRLRPISRFCLHGWINCYHRMSCPDVSIVWIEIVIHDRQRTESTLFRVPAKVAVRCAQAAVQVLETGGKFQPERIMKRVTAAIRAPVWTTNSN